MCDSAYAVTDLESNIPQQCDQFVQLLLQCFIRLLIEQDQQINIGFRVQLASAVAADRNQGQRGRHG